MANHSICTYGTFGLWGVLLGQQGEVVMPKEYKTLEPNQKNVDAVFHNWKYI